MFGSRRKKIAKMTIEMAKQPLAIFQHNYGLPANFWTDDFVLGYFGATIGMISKIIGEDRLSQADKGFILCDAFTALSNMNGDALVARFVGLTQSNPKNDVFELGADNGSIVTLAVLGKVTPIGQKAVAEAREIAVSRGCPENMLTILTMNLFVEPMCQRFDLQ